MIPRSVELMTTHAPAPARSALAQICKEIFENLPIAEARDFDRDISDAIAVGGKDLSRVHWAFLAATLSHLPPTPEDIRAVIDTVSKGMARLACGQEWSNAREAAEAVTKVEARWATRATAAPAAAWAATAAAKAAATAAATAKAVSWAALCAPDAAAVAAAVAKALLWASRAAPVAAVERQRQAAALLDILHNAQAAPVRFAQTHTLARRAPFGDIP